MVAPIPGDRYIRTLVHYLEANQARIAPPPLPHQPSHLGAIPESKRNDSDTASLANTLASFFNPSASHATRPASVGHSAMLAKSQSAKTHNRPASLYGVQIPYMSLLAAASPATFALSATPYMPPRSSFALDIHHLYFLLVQFENLGLDIGDPALLGEIPDGGVVETETSSQEGKAPSIMSVGSIASTMSTLSLSSGWNFWQRKSSAADKPIHQEILDIYAYFSRVSALKLYMNIVVDPHDGTVKSGQRLIVGYETPLRQDGSVILSLSVFSNLSYLELTGVHPKLLDGWSALQHRLITLVIKDAGIEHVADVVHLGSAAHAGEQSENGKQIENGDQPENGIQDHEWKQLRMFSLTHNSLTTLEPECCQRIRSVTHLDLSHNQLIDTPAALSGLYNLQSLNLSFNMISATIGIYTVLGNIQELDLRGNRLTSLAGLDRLWSLERLDIQDNAIDDVDEVGRLTSLPNIADIWIEGNPFTKLHSDYRVTLFCAFKKNDIDIQLNGSHPTFAERRRVFATTAKDTYTAPSAEIAPIVAVSPKNSISMKDGKAADTERVPVKAGKKKIPRAKTKRIVRLEREDDGDTGDKDHGRSGKAEQAKQTEPVEQKAATKRRSRSKTKDKPSTPPTAEEVTESPAASLSPRSEGFRRKIESMRREAGTGWLRVLKEMELQKKNDTK